jgi:hypothetical protein
MRKTYVPQMAKTMHYLGKYIHEHRATLYASIEDDDRLTNNEKAEAKKVLDMVMQHHDIFWKLHAVRSPREIDEEMRRKKLR